jgi:hypothetical protein
VLVSSQSQFDPSAYSTYLKSNWDKTSDQLLSQYPRGTYYSDRLFPDEPYNYAYLDTIIDVFGITEDELELLARNQFVVTERLSYPNMVESLEAEQKILSCILFSYPFDPEPEKLPVSYRLFGQRFVIDSYIFSNVVYDRIVYQGVKVWRGLPDLLDPMFVLGNNNAGELLQPELDSFCGWSPWMKAR